MCKMNELKKVKEVLEIMKCLKELKKLKDELYKEGKRKRSCAVRKFNRNRKTHGYYAATFLKVKMHDQEQFFVHTRMTKEVFQCLLSCLAPFLQKHSMREPISPECRLSLTLLYLSQGCSIQCLAWSYKVGKETARTIIIETCSIIWKCLGPIYLSEPNKTELQQIEQDFWTMWNMPNCIGAIDGKHIPIQCPPHSGSQFFNYKKFYSTVLLAVSDARYTFTHIDVGAYGSPSDGGIFQSSNFGKRLIGNSLDIPRPKELPGTNTMIPHYLVGDAAFPLTKNLMRPYPGTLLPHENEIFNKRLFVNSINVLPWQREI